MIGVYPGSFCPPTVGHVNVIERAARLCDKLYVVVGLNETKTNRISAEDRKSLLEFALKDVKNVEVVVFNGFMTDFCKQVGANVMIKSLRNSSDVDVALLTQKVNSDFWRDGETLFLAADAKYASISSTLVRELADCGQSLRGYVPAGLEDKIANQLKRR